MARYHYQSQVVGIDQSGIHSLRNGLAVKTIHWNEVTSATIKVGMDYENWLLMLLLGAGMILLGGYMMVNTVFLNDSNLIDGNYFLQGNFLSMVSIGLGALLVVLGVRRTMVLHVEAGTLRRNYSLREIVKKGHLHGVAAYVQSHLRSGTSFSFEPGAER